MCVFACLLSDDVTLFFLNCTLRVCHDSYSADLSSACVSVVRVIRRMPCLMNTKQRLSLHSISPEPGPSRPSWGPSEQPLAAVGAPRSRDGHQRPGALQTHVEQRSAVCSDSELSTELSWRKRLLEQPPETGG